MQAEPVLAETETPLRANAPAPVAEVRQLVVGPDRSREGLEERLPLAAARWARWMAGWVAGLREPEARAWARAAWRGDAVARRHFAARARAALGEPRSLQVERASEVLFEDRERSYEALVLRWEALATDAREATFLADHARLQELAAPANVLGVALLGLLEGDEPVDAATASWVADAFLAATSQWLDGVRATLEARASAARLTTELPPSWGAEHPSLMPAVLALVGALADDPAVTAIRLAHRRDPEDGRSAAVITFDATDDPWDVRERVLDRAQRVGWLAHHDDDRGGTVVLGLT